jgi:hypothetical protein
MRSSSLWWMEVPAEAEGEWEVAAVGEVEVVVEKVVGTERVSTEVAADADVEVEVEAEAGVEVAEAEAGVEVAVDAVDAAMARAGTVFTSEPPTDVDSVGSTLTVSFPGLDFRPHLTCSQHEHTEAGIRPNNPDGVHNCWFSTSTSLEAKRMRRPCAATSVDDRNGSSIAGVGRDVSERSR